MAASKILSAFATAATVTITMTSLANGTGQASGVIDNTTTRASMALVFLLTKTGGTAPTANTPIKVYAIRRSNEATDISDNAIGTADATVTAEPTQAECLGSIIVSAATGTAYSKSFIFYDLSPKYSFVVWNAIGQALSTTAGDHVMQVIPVVPEAQ